jgi:hypothetical protein
MGRTGGQYIRDDVTEQWCTSPHDGSPNEKGVLPLAEELRVQTKPLTDRSLHATGW